jgi:hypothetical protein
VELQEKKRIEAYGSYYRPNFTFDRRERRKRPRARRNEIRILRTERMNSHSVVAHGWGPRTTSAHWTFLLAAVKVKVVGLGLCAPEVGWQVVHHRLGW